ncbi:serine-rich adhesin for platelets-like isoform X2 [Anopheles albimanus]|uniref:Max-binding protein MNT n=1 Tax=Anopheles albimanus TaxID=7167 RepID=A0A8W7K680_ANOAL|nr:serine-rich adhesin for platelets-like isoform X2 [Anopheles albimanus]XP_035780501.1 serine-rich adhesin for platelets-like isoform X2 [Anopheles albimanus]
MLSGLDTLLEAAKFLEQQEQQHHHHPHHHHHHGSHHQPQHQHHHLVQQGHTNVQQQSASVSRSHRTPPPLHQRHANGTATAPSSTTTATIVPTVYAATAAAAAAGTVTSATPTSATTISFVPVGGPGVGNGHDGGFSTPPLTVPSGTANLNGGVASNGSSTISTTKVLLNGLGVNGTSGTGTAAAGRLLSPTLVGLPAAGNGALFHLTPASVAAATTTTIVPRQQPSASISTTTTSPALLNPLTGSASRKRTLSNASSSSNAGAATTTATVLVSNGTAYVKDEPLVNGHSTAPPLVVISSNGGGSLMGGAVLQKHGSVNHVSTVASTSIASTTSSPMTIDLSTKHQPNMVPFHHHHTVTHPLVAPSTTPPSSALSSSSSTSSSSSSSTLTVSPVDVDSQSSLSLSNGGSIPNGYVTAHSNNNSSSSSNSNSNSSISANINSAGNLSSLAGTLSPLTTTTGTVVTNGVPSTGALPIGLNGVAVTVAAASSVPGSNNTAPGHHHTGLHHLPLELQQQVAAGLSAQGSQTAGAALFANIPARRRTTSSNSNGVGTREVHNKLEKNRRAHLKECFEQLKKQLSLQPDEKKISNLSILHAAIRHIQVLKRKEREFEHEMERLAKEKIAAQNRILLLKREITQMGDVDVSRLAPDTDMTPNPTTNGGSAGVVASGLNLVGTTVQSDRDQSSETVLVSGRNGIRYSSSSSLSSIATNASISTLPHQTTISPVLSISSPSRGSPALNRNSTSPPSSSSSSSLSSVASSLSVSSVSAASLMVPLSLTTKGGNVLEAHNISSTAPSTLKFSTGPLNGLNLSNSATALTVNGATVMNGTTGSTTTAQLPVIVGANGTANIVGITHSQLLATTAAGVNGSTAIQTIPLNLNVTSTTNVCNGMNGSAGLPTAAIISSAAGLHLAPSSAQALQLTTASSANSSSSSSTSNSIGTTAGITVSSGNSINGAFATAGGKTNASVYSAMPGVSVGNLMGMTGKELINGTINGKNGTVRTDTSKLEIIATQSPTNNATVVAANGTTGALDPPGTKVITYALTSVDKDSKMGVVYSPIQLLTQQGLRVIQQSPNGLATIELSAPSNVGNRLQLHLTH